ncbi:MAG: nucleotide exchange factor GrpE [Planctomycetes bacterium]|nr:nucleotide exchange factor GrpE [Planctomycetota bacterium]
MSKRKKNKTSSGSKAEEKPQVKGSQEEIKFEGGEGQAPVDKQKAAAAAAYANASRSAESAQAETPAEALAADGEMVPAGLLREAESKRDEYLNIAKLAQADLENYRRRVQKEAAVRKREILAEIIKDLIPAMADLKRVIEEGEKKHDYETLHTGVKLTRDNIWKVIEKTGIKEIDAVGKPFDPREHEAMAAVPSPAHEPNTVMEVFQPGYVLDDFVLVPAKVIVSAAAN